MFASKHLRATAASAASATPAPVVTARAVHAGHLRRPPRSILGLAALLVGVVIGIGSCTLPQPPIPKLEVDHGQAATHTAARS